MSHNFRKTYCPNRRWKQNEFLRDYFVLGDIFYLEVIQEIFESKRLNVHDKKFLDFLGVTLINDSYSGDKKVYEFHQQKFLVNPAWILTNFHKKKQWEGVIYIMKLTHHYFKGEPSEVISKMTHMFTLPFTDSPLSELEFKDKDDEKDFLTTLRTEMIKKSSMPYREMTHRLKLYSNISLSETYLYRYLMDEA